MSPTTRLIAPATGALLAKTDVGLLRTDDGGLTWTTISPPGSPAIVEVDANNHDHLVAASEHSTFSSIDGGATWNRMADLPDRAVSLVLSAADPGLTM